MIKNVQKNLLTGYAHNALHEKSVSGQPIFDNYRNDPLSLPERKDYLTDPDSRPRDYRRWLWLIDRLNYSRQVYNRCIDIDPEKCGGVPVLSGTRVTVSRLLAELASDLTLSQIADDLSLDQSKFKALLESISIAFDRSMHEHSSARRMREHEASDGTVYGGGENQTASFPHR